MELECQLRLNQYTMQQLHFDMAAKCKADQQQKGLSLMASEEEEDGFGILGQIQNAHKGTWQSNTIRKRLQKP